MDKKALKNDIIRIFKNDPNILTSEYESLAEQVIAPMQTQYDKDSEDWEEARKQLEKRIAELEAEKEDWLK